MTTATATENKPTYSLTIDDQYGSPMHQINFRPMGDTVKISDRWFMRKKGEWVEYGKDRVMTTAKARTHYRNAKRFGYR